MADFLRKYMKYIMSLLLLAIPLLLKDRYLQDIMVMTFLWAGLASSWNLNCGYSRRFSIGHGAFLGIGAYTSSILYMQLRLSPWVGMLAGVAISVVLAFLLGRITLRLKGTFFVLTTIAFSEILRILATNLRDLTGGSMGLQIPYREGLISMSWNDKIPWAIITWVYMIALVIISARMEKSRFGYSLVAIGQDKDAAETLGVDSTTVMVKAYVLSAALTAVGGTLFAQYIMYVEPTTVMGLNQSSLQFVMIAIIGGVGTAFGPMIGALIIVPLSTLLRGTFSDISGLHGFLYGLVLLLVVLIKPDGIIVQIERLWQFILRCIDKPKAKGGATK